MRRQPLIDQLERYSEMFPEEIGVVRRFLEFVRHHENCFERSLAIGHVTGSAWLINAEGSETLLTRHRKLNKWLQTGGHADGESDTLLVAMREAGEESGLTGLEAVSREIFDLDIHLIPERRGEGAHWHFDVRYLLRHGGSEQFTVSDESHELAWVPLAALETYSTETSLLRMRDKTALFLGLGKSGS